MRSCFYSLELVFFLRYVLIEAIPRNKQDRQTVDLLQKMDDEVHDTFNDALRFYVEQFDNIRHYEAMNAICISRSYTGKLIDKIA